MARAKVMIEVVAGIMVDEIMPEYTKRFGITSEEWEDPTGEPVMRVYGFAQEYMRCLWSPQRVNWVRCDWIYF